MPESSDATRIERQLTQIILNSSHGEALLPVVLQAVGEAFQAERSWLVAASDSQITPEIFSWEQGSSELEAAKELEPPVMANWLALTQLLAIADGATEDRGESWMPAGMKAMLVAPISSQGREIGAIAIGKLQPHAWSDAETELLEVLSVPVGLAIRASANAGRQLQAQARTATQYQNLLHQLAIASHHHWDLDRLLQMAISETARALQVKRGSILRLKYPETAVGKNSIEAAGSIQVTAIAEWVEGKAEFKKLLNRQFALSDCRWCQRALADAPEPLAIADKQEASLKAASGKKKAAILDEPNLPALLVVPLWRAGEAAAQNQVLGFLVLQHHLPRPWQPEELALANWVGIQVSTAIVQSQTLQQVQTEVEDRTSQLQSSLELQEKLYEKMRQQVGELKQLYEVKNQFVSDMSDRLKHPLTAMRIAIRLLRQPELPIEKRNQYLDIIDRQCTEEINLIEDLLSLQRLDSKPMPQEWQSIDFKQTILDLTESFEQKWSDRGLSLAVELPPSAVRLQTDINSLNRILLELLTNAGKYSEPNTTVYLRLTQQKEALATKVKEISNSDFDGHGSQAILTIRNTGFCISEAELPRIFDRFVRSQAVIQPVRGTGLGLALVKSLVEYLHGRINVSSCAIADSQSCETCFTLMLPQFIDSYRS